MAQELPWLIAKKQVIHLKELFMQSRLDLWLEGLVSFCNQQETHPIEFMTLFQDWHKANQQLALNFISNPKFVDLVNAIFFYKLYPEKLFLELISPDKMVSVRMRLGILHSYIESIQQQLYSTALQNDLSTGIDHILHGNELPKGVSLEVDVQYQTMIQIAIKKLKIVSASQTIKQENLDLLYALRKAYKYCFNPNLLIDAAMRLEQCLVPEDSNKERFQQEMVILFRKLTTTECLDFYGYFNNKDSRNLLYTLSANPEQATIKRILSVLSSVMDALRIELKNRHLDTEPFVCIIDKENIYIDQRNRDAMPRAIAIYGHQAVNADDKLEQLFELIEESE